MSSRQILNHKAPCAVKRAGITGIIMTAWRIAARNRIQNWEIIADNFSKAGWSWGCVSAIDCQGRTIWIADAHRDDGKRFVVKADEKLTAFLELESAIRVCGELV
jgi:hypothetical protein